MTGFVGREAEISQIMQLTRLKKACFVVIKGRRRIGKSRLAQECARLLKGYQQVYMTGLAPEAGITAEKEREDFAEQLANQMHIPRPRADSWNDLLWALSERTRSGKWVIILDEINWLGQKEPAFLSQLKSTWDRDFSKNPQLILIVSGSLSGWINQNILHSTGFLGRIDLDLTLDELTLQECKAFLAPAHDRIAPYELLKILAVTGGVPSYLEQIDATVPAEQNLMRLCFKPSGFLFREFENLFHDLFQKKNFYRNLINAVADTALDLETIYQKLEIEKAGYVSAAIDDLIQAGFLARHHTWTIKSASQSKLSKIRISDNYTRFYFKCILPNKTKIERGILQLPPGIYSIMGLQFENLVLKNRTSLWKILNLPADAVVMDGPYFQRETKQKKGCQIDYLIQCRYNMLYVVEIKFHKTTIKASVIQEVREKIDALSRPKGFSCRPVLIHVNGVEDAVAESEYFDEIIDFSTLLG